MDVNLVRDKKTGKSKGFAFLAYEDQRSTILAVDNFNGISLCGRTIRVDHVKDYKPPNFHQGNGEFNDNSLYKPSGPDGRGWGRFREYTEEEKKVLEAYKEESRETEKNSDVLQNLKKRATEVLKDEDEIWEKRLMSQVDRDIYEDNKEIQDARKMIEEEREKARIIKEELKEEKRMEKLRKKIKNNET